MTEQITGLAVKDIVSLLPVLALIWHAAIMHHKVNEHDEKINRLETRDSTIIEGLNATINSMREEVRDTKESLRSDFFELKTQLALVEQQLKLRPCQDEKEKENG